MDPADVKSYQPIPIFRFCRSCSSDLSLVSFWSISTRPYLQPAHQAYHSTETVVLKVLGDILQALDSGDLAMLTLLHLLAALDSQTHDVVATAGDVIWFTQSCAGLASVIPRQPHAVCPSWHSFFHRHLSFVWSPTGVGPRTDLVRAIHRGLVGVGRETSTPPTSVR